MPKPSMRLSALLILTLATPCASAGGGLLGLDHNVNQTDTGIWARRNQLYLEYASAVVELGGALWFGRDDRLGRAFWQSFDASAIGAVASLSLKHLAGRARPRDGGDPDLWRQGNGNLSFPSGEVTQQAAFVTPLIMEYRVDHPGIWALELLPLYDAIARVKSRAHWQSDVLAGWLLGSATGYYSATQTIPFSVQWLPGQITIGIRTRF